MTYADIIRQTYIEHGLTPERAERLVIRCRLMAPGFDDPVDPDDAPRLKAMAEAQLLRTMSMSPIQFQSQTRRLIARFASSN